MVKLIKGPVRIMEPEGREGKGVSDLRIADSKTPTESLMIGLGLFPVGCQPLGMHYHDVEEAMYILFGHGKGIDIEGNGYELSPGVCFYCEGGKSGSHDIINDGKEPLIILYIYPKSEVKNFVIGRNF